MSSACLKEVNLKSRMGADYVREAQNALSAAIAEILHFTAV
jgi:hypothetical protein